MAATETRTLDELVDEALDRVYRVGDRPRMVTLAAQGLDSPADTTLTLVDHEDVSPTNVLEVGNELLYVRSKTADPVPVFTVVRGYAGTPVSDVVATGTNVYLEPPWTRWEMRRAVLRAIAGPISQAVPEIRTETLSLMPGKLLIELPAQTLGVHRVGYMDTEGVFTDLTQWEFYDFLPAEVSVTGRAVRVSPLTSDEDRLAVTYTVPHLWRDGTGAVQADPAGDCVVNLPYGGGDLPALYASAYLVAGREVSRVQLDRVEEWNVEMAARQGVNVRLIRELWGDFYRRLEETRRTYQPPKHRPYVKMRRGL